MNILKSFVLMLAALSFSVAVHADDAKTTLSKPSKGTDHLSGQIGHAGSHEKGAKGKKGTSSELVLHVSEHHGKKGGDAGAKHGKTVTLSATGDILAKLNEFAKKHAHVKVSGTISGDTMTVTDVTEEHHKGKGK